MGVAQRWRKSDFSLSLSCDFRSLMVRDGAPPPRLDQTFASGGLRRRSIGDNG
jgi:hypothetical protein